MLFRIEDEPHKIVEAVTASPNHFPGVDARAFAEGHILGGNRDAALVRAYVSFCRESWCEQEAMQLLEAQGIQMNQ